MSVTYGPNLALLINALTGDSYPGDFRKFLRAIDALLEGAVIDRTHTAPPGSPANGDRYLVAASPTGAFAGQANSIAVWTTDNPITPSGLWEFYVPKPGWLVWSIADASLYAYSAGAWVAAGGGGGGGGFSNPMTAAGDLIVGGVAGAPARLPIGTSGQVLAVISGVLAWATPGGGGGPSTLAGDSDVLLTSPANGDLLTFDTASGLWKNKPASGGGGGGGDVGKNMITMLPGFTGSDNGYSGTTVIFRITASQVAALGSSLKLRFDILAGGSVTLVAAVLRRTLPNDFVWIDSNTITWGGSATPTLAASSMNFSDPVTVPIDTAHDFYFLVAVGSSGGANYPKTPNSPASYGLVGCGYQGGNQTATADASTIQSPAAVFISMTQVVIAS
jgi:hypothetical protein